jgi:SET domain-containing protein
MTEPLDLPRHPGIRVVDFAGKGRGVIVDAAIAAGTLLEIAPVLPLRREELGHRTEGIFSYPFDWPDPPYAEAVALGVVSLLNHSPTPNADFEPDLANRVIRLFATRDLQPGEEVTINYGIPLWFEEA